MNYAVRVRFSPSPTGNLHIGTARTALFNWLFARNVDGTFVLRIEDTDRERSDPRYEKAITEDLAWLGLAWDEGPDVGGPFAPYRQSERGEKHREIAEKLLHSDRAYLCYCTPEELESRRREALAAGRMPKYDGRCRDLTGEEKRRFVEEGRRPTVRYRVEPGTTTVFDLIRGNIDFDHDVVGDFVLLRSDGAAAYNFAVTVDDGQMRISHVIRGEDHLTNTVRQLMLYEDLAWQPPVFAHLSMISGPDGAKLSKRHGAIGIGEFRDQGYLPSGVTNYLALLGWSHPAGKEIFGLDEAAATFEIERVSKSPAIFDADKLRWINGQYIRDMDCERLVRLVLSFAPADRDLRAFEDAGKLEELVGAAQEGAKVLADFGAYARIYTKSVGVPDEAALRELRTDTARRAVEVAREMLAASGELDEAAAKELLGELRERLKPEGLAGRRLFMPLRAALTGTTSGPELFHVLSILGRDESLNRLADAAGRMQGGARRV